MTAVAETPALLPAPGRGRQLRLLEVGNPLTERFGAAFFQGLPRGPGVYFFHDTAGRLLYIGQSGDLRARVGSYRHVCPERHPRRTLRLVHRIARILWTPCATAAAAQELEAALLLEHRPPFNRAGVWQPPPWWLGLDLQENQLLVRLERAPPAAQACAGPLPASFRYAHAALLRCLLRALRPDLPLAGLPVGWLNPTLPRRLSLPLPPAQTEPHGDLPGLITGFATRRCGRLLTRLRAALLPEKIASALEQPFWADQLETLGSFHASRRPAPPAAPPAAPAAMPGLCQANFLL